MGDIMKKTLKKKRFIALFILVGVIIIVFSNPIRWPKPILRSYLLMLTPIGVNMDEVIEILEKKIQWEISSTMEIDKEQLFDFYGHLTFTHSKQIKTYLGSYYNPFKTAVEAYWHFDEDEKLIDIRIRKTVDSI